MMIRSRSARLLWRCAGISQALLLCGCIPIPITHAERGMDMPGLEARVPADIRGSQNDVLLLIQTTRSATGSSNVTRSLDAQFVAGNRLAEHLRNMATSSNLEVELLVCGGYTCGAVPLAFAGREASLERLCAVSQDGRGITLFPMDNPSAPMETRIYQQRRAALVSALRSDTTYPFETVDGPCGVGGEVRWPSQTRARAIEFLASIPGRQAGDEYKGLAEIFGRSKSAFDAADFQGGGGILLVSTTVRGERAAQAPMYFSQADFKALQSSLVSRHPTEILPLLEFNQSGRNAPEHMSLSLLCAVGIDGSLLWWNKEQRAWRGPEEKPHEEEWEAMKSAMLNGLPEIDGQRLRAFLDRAAVPTRLASDELPKVLATAHDEKDAKQLLLGITFSASGIVVSPVFLESANISEALWLIRPLRAGQSAKKLLGLGGAGSGLDHVCVISKRGVLVEFRQTPFVSADEIWKETRSTHISEAWRKDAIGALVRDGTYQGQFICWLQDTDSWSEVLRTKVANFLKETVTAEAAARPTTPASSR